MVQINFKDVAKRYADGTDAVRSLNIDVRDGEFLVMVGPSGCGKTTALRMVAGLESITGGELVAGNRVINNLAPRDRNFAMVFQNYALYPHMTIFENIAFPLECEGVAKAEIKKRVEHVVGMLDLEPHLYRKPKSLSGGQRQRVAMGRAVIRRPHAFLMDEPLSNLDAKLRVQMRSEITQLQHDLGTTTLYVTHDQVEAMTMGDRIAVMNKGVLQQVGTPLEIYERPLNMFVAAFVGSPSINLLSARLERTGDGVICVVGEQRFGIGATPELEAWIDRGIVFGVRPEDVSLRSDAAGKGATLKAEFVLSEMVPPEQLVHLDLGADVVVAATEEFDGDGTPRNLQNGKIIARIPSEYAISPGTGEWAIRKGHFFDPANGALIASVRFDLN
ncbi:ABC transporter ATP-binding protein [Cucumibacter marinus]|uniref:ABC transporter ATP-binding protein n=1 Tax=Cucumibacter marinus TaxID=1121252 RepID=UPI00040F475C|nr:sn-glycerol-3-phosphate ABC transporter ATP-binding protein UgpC [Cucumibacter marinus]